MSRGGIDAALSKLDGIEPKKKAAPVKQKPEALAATVDFAAEGLDGCKRIMADFEGRIAALQQQMAALPPTKGNKPKIADLKRRIEEQQRDPDYRGALMIVRQQEEEDRELRRGLREREEEDSLMAGVSKKASLPQAQSVQTKEHSEIEEPDDFEPDLVVVGFTLK